MSLINDALKRAKQSQQQNSTGAPPLPPVEIASRGGTGWLLPALVIMFVAGACFFIGLAFSKRKSPPENSPAAAIVPAPQKVETVTAPVVAANPPAETVSPSPAAPKVETAAAETNPPAPVEKQAAVVLPISPNLKVQGIFYDPAKPWAIVNGKTVYAGDHIGEFRVKAISKFRVTFVGADGKEKSLGLGE
jgi:hypothetical protein